MGADSNSNSNALTPIVPALECQYCHCTITERDMATHYIHCHMVRYALDDKYWPFANEAYKERVKLRARNDKLRRQAKLVAANKGPGIVLNKRSTTAYNAPRQNGRFTASNAKEAKDGTSKEETKQAKSAPVTSAHIDKASRKGKAQHR